VTALVGRLGYVFQDEQLLERALTHASGAKSKIAGSNERLEFLGDRVLGLVVAQILYEQHDDVPEGDLARMLNMLVRRQTCAKVGDALGIPDALVLAGKGDKRTVVTDNIVGNACEALIAAVYLDGGLEAARTVISEHWAGFLKRAPDMRKDAKSSLQEWAAARSLPAPYYETIDTTGPDHAPQFTVELTVEGRKPARGMSSTRRTAEQVAATEFLHREGIWT
ncbi:MAG: ribonuclease III, partial [Pseudomonadota bacterium]